ncbi:doublecortin domain-containing protein-like isoform X2 [Hylaeus volcanicus]|uniref:doublecortin domain-containing protein-like isoform X2 n=1 Tax=Hylaeus volcanicus TaxID=313075 RepID=UPI0023B7BF46|nr:doublecortin domain-containing protein-like isoform X2 [Hylaeus volcanicus]
MLHYYCNDEKNIPHNLENNDQDIGFPVYLINKKFQCFPRKYFHHRNVWERLTDYQLYTGIHKERFDEFGNGRGLAGREYVYLHDGMTESPSRTHEVFSSSIRYPRQPVVEPGMLGIQRFGVQTITPKLMWLYRNGDKHHAGSPYFLKSHVKTMQFFYQEATKVVEPIAGPVRKIYDQNLNVVSRLEDIIEGGKYLCSSGELPANTNRLEKFLSEWVIHTT